MNNKWKFDKWVNFDWQSFFSLGFNTYIDRSGYISFILTLGPASFAIEWSKFD